MKHLKECIYEGIFDTEKNIVDTHELEKNMFEDPESDFWKFCSPCLSNGHPVWSVKDLTKEIDINKNIITIESDVQLDTKYTNPFTNKYSLYCGKFYLGDLWGRGPHPEPVNNGAGFKDIHADGGVRIDGMCEKMGGFKFIIGNSNTNLSHNSVRIFWVNDLDYFDADFKFENEINSTIFCDNMYDWPNLKNVTSNAQIISMYDPSLFDQDSIKSSLDKFFGKGTVTANGITKTKSIRNIVAIVNNIRKYGALIPTEVIPEGKLSDLIDLRGFKNIKKVVLSSNNVHISFIKPNDNDVIMRQARFIRMNNMKLFKDTPIDELVYMVRQCQTKDGWIVLFEPSQF